MKRVTSICIVACVIVMLPGCQNAAAPTNTPANPPVLRVLSANLVNDTFDVCVEDEVVLEGVRFGQSSSWVNVTAGPGTYDIVMTSPGAECAEGILLINLIDLPFDADTLNTIVVSPDGASGYRLIDNASATQADRTRVRVINASEDSISVSITEVDGDALFSQVRFNETADFDYTEIVAGMHSFTVTSQAKENAGQLFEDFEFKAGFVYTIFISGRVDGVDKGFETAIYVDTTVGVGIVE